MTGPEHFREAERLAVEARHVSPSFHGSPPYDEHVTGTQHASELTALAQVHATLALAAATAMDFLYLHPDTTQAWAEAIGAGGPE